MSKKYISNFYGFLIIPWLILLQPLESHGTQFGPVPTVNSPNEVEEFIKARQKEGSDHIKIIFERGGPDNPMPSIDSTIIAAAAMAALEMEITTVVHASRQEDALASIRAGANGLAHMWRRNATPITDTEVQMISKSGAFITPTLLVYRKAVEDADWPIDLDLQTHEVGRLYKAGVPILVGTDPPNFDLGYGKDIFYEFQLLKASGMSPLDVLKAATSLPAESFRQTQHGHLRVGQSADMILVNGDPTSKILTYTDIEFIWKKGRRIK